MVYCCRVAAAEKLCVNFFDELGSGRINVRMKLLEVDLFGCEQGLVLGLLSGACLKVKLYCCYLRIRWPCW